MTDPREIRTTSWSKVRAFGLDTNENLPSLESDIAIHKSCDVIVDRVLGMLCAAACSYGFDKVTARRWLSREARTDQLTSAERHFLETGSGNTKVLIDQIEGIWALCWSIGIVNEMDFGVECSSDFHALLPDLKNQKSSISFREQAQLRPLDELISTLDLAYCLHWSTINSLRRGKKLPAGLELAIVAERRRALEWITSDDSWDEVSLDT